RDAIESGHEVLDDLGQPRVLRADVFAVLEHLDRMRRVTAGADQADAHMGAAHVGRDERRVGAPHGVHWHRVGGCGHVVSGRPPPSHGAVAVKWAGVWKYVDNDVNTSPRTTGRGRANDDKNIVDCIRLIPLITDVDSNKHFSTITAVQQADNDAAPYKPTLRSREPSGTLKTWLAAQKYDNVGPGGCPMRHA